jgi:hypothetical protein
MYFYYFFSILWLESDINKQLENPIKDINAPGILPDAAETTRHEMFKVHIIFHKIFELCFFILLTSGPDGVEYLY